MIAAVLMLFACSATLEQGGTAVVEPGQTEQTQQPQMSTADTDSATPLLISRDVKGYKDGYIVYPRVIGTAAESINASIYNEVTKRANEQSRPIFTDYRIEYNSDGIFSVLIYVWDFSTDELLFIVPLTYNARTGKKQEIIDMLDAENDRWRRLIPQMITIQAQSRGIMLLNDLLPISDTQEFYITDEYLVLVYRVYEIATYDAGSPVFPIQISALKEYISQSSPLNCLVIQAAELPPTETGHMTEETIP